MRVQQYMAWATDPNNDNELLETRKFLNDTVVDRNHFITSFKARDGSSFVWCGLTLDAGALHKGTKVASVALVQRFGVAKKATLISVKTTSEAVDNLAAIEMAYADISIKNPARAKKSVVNISWTLGNSANIESELR